MKFRRVLVANRGEIALRITRTLKKMGITSVAIFDEREKNAAYVTKSDESFSLGSGDLTTTFLNIPGIIQLAVRAEADAIHPGYGFLSENPLFARRCIEAGIIFIGPEPETMELLGDKMRSLELARRLEIPVIPGVYGQPKEIIEQVYDSLFPCLIKASGGGGGKAMRMAYDRKELPELLVEVSGEAAKYFVNPEVYVEKYLEDPRHVEVQVVADQFGNMITLGERECSVQRRYQKIIEEAPACFLSTPQRNKLSSHSLHLAREAGFMGVGTVEFLVDRDGMTYFLEVNTRLQVEHAITEEVFDIDLVEEQIMIAAGYELSKKVMNSKPRGHAIEARVYAEDPTNSFFPVAGTIKNVYLPEFNRIRSDTDIESNQTIYTDFDPLIAKIIAWGIDRYEAINRLKAMLNGTIVQGIVTNIPLLIGITEDEDYIANKVSTHFILEKLPGLNKSRQLQEREFIELAIAGICLSSSIASSYAHRLPSAIKAIGYWRVIKKIKAQISGIDVRCQIIKSTKENWVLDINNNQIIVILKEISDNHITFLYHGREVKVYYSLATTIKNLLLSFDYRVFNFIRSDLLGMASNRIIQSPMNESSLNPSIIAPLAGKIVKVNCAQDDIISKGDTILTIESMKMENEIRAVSSGKVRRLLVQPNTQVNEGDLLLELEPFADN